MANDITQRVLQGALGTKRAVKLINIVSDATAESGLVVFNHEQFFENGRLMKFKAYGSTCLVRLEFEATDNAPIVSFDPVNNPCGDFECFGGITNPNTAGVTGNILMNVTGLASGGEITILLEIA